MRLDDNEHNDIFKHKAAGSDQKSINGRNLAEEYNQSSNMTSGQNAYSSVSNGEILDSEAKQDLYKHEEGSDIFKKDTHNSVFSDRKDEDMLSDTKAKLLKDDEVSVSEQETKNNQAKEFFKRDHYDELLSNRNQEDMLSDSKSKMFDGQSKEDALLNAGKELGESVADQIKSDEADGETASQVIKNYDEQQQQKAEKTAEAAVKLAAAVVVAVVTEGAGSGAVAAEAGEAGAAGAEAGAAGAEAANTAKSAETTAAMAHDITAEELSKEQAETAAQAIKKKEEEEKANRLLNKSKELTKMDDESLKKAQTKQAKEIVKGELRKESLAQELSKETGVNMKKQALGASIASFALAPFLLLIQKKLKVALGPILGVLGGIAVASLLLIGIIAAIIGALRVTLTMNLDSAPDDRTVYTLVRTLPETWNAAVTNQAKDIIADYETKGQEVNLIYSLGSPNTLEVVAIWYARRTYEAPVESETGAWASYISASSGLEIGDNSSWYHKSDDAYGGAFAIKELAEAEDKEGLDAYNMPMSDLLALYTISQDYNFTMLSIEEREESKTYVPVYDAEGNLIGGEWDITTKPYITTTSEFLTPYDYYTEYDCSDEIQMLADKCMAGEDAGFNYLWKYLTRRTDSPESQFRFLMIELAIKLWDSFGCQTAANKWNNSIAQDVYDMYAWSSDSIYYNEILANAMYSYMNGGASAAFNKASFDEDDTLAEIFGSDGQAEFEQLMGKLPSGCSWTGTTWNNYIARVSKSGGSPAWCAFFVSGLANNGTKGYFLTEYTWYLNAGLNVDSIADAGYNGDTVSFNELTSDTAGTYKSLTDQQLAQACYDSKTWRSTYALGFTYKVLGSEKTLCAVDCGNGNIAILYQADSDTVSAVLSEWGLDTLNVADITWPGGKAPSWFPTSGSISISPLEDKMPYVSDEVKSTWWAAVKADAQNNDTPVFNAFPHSVFSIPGLANSAGIAGLTLHTSDYIVSLTSKSAPYVDTGSTKNLVEYMINGGSVYASPADDTATYTIAFDPYESGWNTDTLVDNKGTSSAEVMDDSYKLWLDGQPTYCLPEDLANPPYIVPPLYSDGGSYWFDYSKASFSPDGLYMDASTCKTSIVYQHQKGFYIPCFDWIESDAGYYWDVDDSQSDEKFWQLCWALGQNYDSSMNIGYDLLAEIPQRSLEYFEFGQGGCSQMYSYYNSKGWIYNPMSAKDSFQPLPGDLMLYRTKQGDGYSSYLYYHVGLVVATTEPNAAGIYYIITIEGNTGQGYTDGGGTVWLRITKSTDLWDSEAGTYTRSFVCMPY